MNVNSTASGTAYGALSSASNGLSGLVSGMDTDTMVEKMLAAQQAKIDKQNQNKQVYEWKQTMYRDVISKINTFNSKYFDILSPTALTSNSFYNTMKAATDSKAFSVSASSSAISGDMRLKIDQLATSTKLEGANLDSRNLLSGSFDTDAFDSRVSLTFAEVTEVLKDSDGKPMLDADGNEQTVVVKESSKVELSSADIDKILNGESVEVEIAGKKDENGNPTKETITFALDTKGKLTIKGSDGNRSFAVDKADSAVSGSGTTQLGALKLGFTSGSTYSLLGSDGKANTFTVAPDTGKSISVEFTLDGNKKSIDITADMTKDSLQAALDHAFGKDTVTVEGTDLSAFSLTVGGGRTLSVSGDKAAMEILGTKNGQSNTVAVGDTIENTFGITENSTFKINGIEIEVSKDDTVSDLLSKINKSDAGVTLEYSSFENKFTMTSTSSGAGFSIDIEDSAGGLMAKVFGVDNIDDALQGPKYTEGVNAKIVLNGISTERSSNSFTVDGLSFNLKATNTEAETLTVTRDTDKIFEGIKSFVNDYNTMIEELNSLTKADATYKEYPPLTDAQRKQMSESEITAWEKKSKEGLLRGDNDITSFLSSLRTSLMAKPANSSISIFDLGIDTSTNYKDNGKLTLDESKLREALNNYPDEVQNLFTYSKTKTEIGADGKTKTVDDGPQGIATAFKSIIKATANTSSGSPGSLVSLAGVANTASASTNTLSLELKRIASRIDVLKDQYDQQKTRYWKQFNTMETVISNLSTQSAWLTQQTM